MQMVESDPKANKKSNDTTEIKSTIFKLTLVQIFNKMDISFFSLFFFFHFHPVWLINGVLMEKASTIISLWEFVPK